MKKNVVRILTAVLMLSMVFSSSVFAAEKTSAWDSFVGLITGSAKTTEDTQVGGVTYRTHIENEGWAQGWVQDGALSGSVGKGLRLEGIEIKLQGEQWPEDLGITYRTHIQNEGWAQGWVEDGEMSGSEGKGLRLEGIEIKLTGDNAADYSVEYQTQIQNEGWAQGWVKDGEMSGSSGKGLRLEAIEIKIVQVEADLTAYNEALEAVNEEDYTPASWAAYQEVVEANEVTTADLQSVVDEATAAIVAAQEELVELGQVTSIFAINATTVEVTFEEDLASVDKSEFAIEGLTVANAAVKQTNKKVVVLTTSAQVGGTEYKLVYQGVDTGLTFTGISAVIPTTISLDSNSIQSKVGSEVTLKANIGQATAGVAVTFNVDAPAGSLNNDVIAEAYTDAAGIATYSYTQYAAGTDAVAAYPTGAPTTRATAKVFWGVSDILTVTESATGGATNGTTRTYTVKLVNPANSVALQGAVVNVTLLENIGANGTTAVVADPTTGLAAVTPFQSATNERAFTVTTNANGQATFTLTGANTTATPIIFVDSNQAALATAGIAGNNNNRLEAFELQVKMPAVAFTGAQSGYTFNFSPMTDTEYATGLTNKREYKAVVTKADGTVYANGQVQVALEQLIDSNLTTTTTAVFTDKDSNSLGPNVQKLTADSKGVITFYVGEPTTTNTNVTATPRVWIDLDAAGNTNGIYENGEPTLLAPTTTFQSQLAQGTSNLTINTTKPVVKAGPVVADDQIEATFEIRNQSNTISTTAGFNRVTYTITNTSGGTVKIYPSLVDNMGNDFKEMTSTFVNGATKNFVNGSEVELNAGSSVTIAGTAFGYSTDRSDTNPAILAFAAPKQDNTLSISATGTTVRAPGVDDTRNVGSVSQAAKSIEIKNATPAVGTFTGEIIGYTLEDTADNFGRLVVKLDGTGNVVTMPYGVNRTGSFSGNTLFVGTDGTFTNFASFNALAFTTLAEQDTQFDAFENRLAVGNRVNATVGGAIYLANIKGTSTTDAINNSLAAAAAPGLTPDPTSTVDNDIEITFVNDPTWLATVAVGDVFVDGTPLLDADYDIEAGKLTLIPSAINNLSVASAKTVTISGAPGFANTQVTQPILAGAVTAAQSTSAINPALGLNAVSTITLTAKDKYSNNVSGYVFNALCDITNTNATTVEVYSIGGQASSVDVTSTLAPTNANGVATLVVGIPAVVDTADGISVQPKLNDGTTSFGTLMSFVKQP